MKKCIKCNQVKFNFEFHKDSSRIDKLSNRCKSCKKEFDNKYNKLDKRKSKIKNCDLKKKYNITLDQKNQMIKDQDYKCIICNTNLLELKSKSIHVDHSHITGKVRGILCVNCNSLLGLVQDNINTLQNAINYLNKG